MARGCAAVPSLRRARRIVGWLVRRAHIRKSRRALQRPCLIHVRIVFSPTRDRCCAPQTVTGRCLRCWEGCAIVPIRVPLKLTVVETLLCHWRSRSSCDMAWIRDISHACRCAGQKQVARYIRDPLSNSGMRAIDQSGRIKPRDGPKRPLPVVSPATAADQAGSPWHASGILKLPIRQFPSEISCTEKEVCGHLLSISALGRSWSWSWSRSYRYSRCATAQRCSQARISPLEDIRCTVEHRAAPGREGTISSSDRGGLGIFWMNEVLRRERYSWTPGDRISPVAPALKPTYFRCTCISGCSRMASAAIDRHPNQKL